MNVIAAAHEHIREIRAHEWKERYCYKHNLFRKTRHGFAVPDIIAAPEPTDEELAGADGDCNMANRLCHYDAGRV